ncbi:rhoGEF domain-containing protein [Phthorimaea operculella]|nr:rhoGEF domain-containing protein [Phthorimaea operculella]
MTIAMGNLEPVTSLDPDCADRTTKLHPMRHDGHDMTASIGDMIMIEKQSLDKSGRRRAGCSTTDLTPTLIGIYDSLLAGKSLRPESEPLETAKDARNDPPVPNGKQTMIEETKDSIDKSIETKTVDAITEQEIEEEMKSKDPTKIAGGVKLPIASVNKSTLYTMRTKSDENGASEKSEVPSDSVFKSPFQRTFSNTKDTSAFGNLSPNVKRMISGATETTTLKLQKKTVATGRSSTRHRSNIPLVGATSKISQSGVELLPSVEIYDQPCSMKSFGKSKSEESEPLSKTAPIKPEFKLDEPQTYDVPTNNRPAIYDVPTNKTAFESLSLPYIDQSVELSITSNDREFDIKLSSKDNSPVKAESKISPKGTPAKIPKMINGGTNSLNRKDFKESPSKLAKGGPYPEAVGSTGNLKSSIPEKEVIRLNPAVEVTRPLSMSSIASSSSTSSSGVQNKGGVNSAYLASIESLDDHSDADMTSANGSNHFVNNAGVKTGVSEERRSESPRQAEELSGLSQLERVCAEIVQTEHVYVEDLRQVVEGYLHEWRREATFSAEELDELFNNIEDIYMFNRSLCEELNSCHLDATCIARCFVNNTSGFSVYTSYCTGYPATMERLAALASDSTSAREFRERQIALGHPLPLASYLLKPVQRILKYHLLLQNVVKQCQSPETEYALLKMTGIAQHIDDMKRRHEHAVLQIGGKEFENERMFQCREFRLFPIPVLLTIS